MDSYGNSPIFFTDKSRKEWEELDPKVKKSVKSILNQCMEEMSLINSVKLLANLLVDLEKRMEILENMKNDQ